METKLLLLTFHNPAAKAGRIDTAGDVSCTPSGGWTPFSPGFNYLHYQRLQLIVNSEEREPGAGSGVLLLHSHCTAMT